MNKVVLTMPTLTWGHSFGWCILAERPESQKESSTLNGTWMLCSNLTR